MLRLSTFIFAAFLASTFAYNLQRNIRHIPVEVRYEENPSGNALKTLEQRMQLSSEFINQAEPEILNDQNVVVLAKANLEEKVQLSSQELPEAQKHIPKNNKLALLEEFQQNIIKGFKDLRDNFKPTEGEVVPDQEMWERLNRDVNEYIEKERNKIDLKQDQGGQNFFQTIASGIQSVANNVVQNFQGNGQQGGNGTQGDEQPGGISGFIGYFQGGMQNIINQISQNQVTSGSGNSTVLGDTGTNPTNQQQGPIGFITGAFSGFQNFLQGSNAPNGTQGDTGTNVQQQGGPGGFFAGAINQLTNVFTGSSPKPPNAQGDEGTNTTNTASNQNPIQVIQSIGNNIGNAITQFVQGGTQQQNKPEDESTPGQNQNFIQQIGSNLGNAFQNIQNNFRPPTSLPPIEIPGASGGSNPIGQISGTVQNVGNQFQQLAGQQNGSNPLQSIQAAIPTGLPGSGSGKNSSESTTPLVLSISEDIQKVTEGSANNESQGKLFIEGGNKNEVVSVLKESGKVVEKLEVPLKSDNLVQSEKKEEIMMAQE